MLSTKSTLLANATWRSKPEVESFDHSVYRTLKTLIYFLLLSSISLRQVALNTSHYWHRNFPYLNLLRWKGDRCWEYYNTSLCLGYAIPLVHWKAYFFENLWLYDACKISPMNLTEHQVDEWKWSNCSFI